MPERGREREERGKEEEEEEEREREKEWDEEEMAALGSAQCTLAFVLQFEYAHFGSYLLLSSLPR